MTIGEYHTAARGQSKKLQLMNIINDCMRHAFTREEFIALMESEGYKVRWEKPLIRANVQTVCRKCAAAFLHKKERKILRFDAQYLVHLAHSYPNFSLLLRLPQKRPFLYLPYS